MKKFLRNVIVLILIAIIGVCLYRIGTQLYNYKVSDDLYNQLQQDKEKYTKNRPSKDSDSNTSNSDNSSNNNNNNNSNSKDTTEKTIDMSPLNKDFICWINVDKTNIDYPVVQSDDNSFYLHRDINKNYLYSGTIFLDYRCDYDTTKNLIIYGHNMKNKTIFSQLENFKDKDFFYSDRKITLTDKNGEREYEVFAVIVVKGNYDYRIPDFDSDKEYSDYLDRIISKSKFKPKEKVTTQDKILTLSTCSYEFDNARTVVFAKEVE